MRTPAPLAAAVLSAAVLSAAVLSAAPSALSAQAPARPDTLPDIVVEVDGLSCPFCAYGIEKKFVQRDAVDSVFVALEENEVRVWLKPTRELTDEQVTETVEEAGFTPGRIRRPRKEGVARR